MWSSGCGCPKSRSARVWTRASTASAPTTCKSLSGLSPPPVGNRRFQGRSSERPFFCGGLECTERPTSRRQGREGRQGKAKARCLNGLGAVACPGLRRVPGGERSGFIGPDSPARPARRSTRRGAVRRSARTRRSACRRADTSSRRSAATSASAPRPGAWRS